MENAQKLSTTVEGVFVGAVRPFGDDQSPSAIVKRPTNGRVRINALGLAGDHQADRRVHGGPDKAVHHYAADNYSRLAKKYPQAESIFKAGVLGENISTSGISESELCVGDIFTLGSAVVQISQPRSPCWKIDERTGVPRLSIFVAENAISGWYYRVLEEGVVQRGESLTLIERAKNPLSLSGVWRLYLAHRPSLDELEHALAQEALSGEWRHRLSTRLNWLKKNSTRRKTTQ